MHLQLEGEPHEPLFGNQNLANTFASYLPLQSTGLFLRR